MTEVCGDVCRLGECAAACTFQGCGSCCGCMGGCLDVPLGGCANCGHLPRQHFRDREDEGCIGCDCRGWAM